MITAYDAYLEKVAGRLGDLVGAVHAGGRVLESAGEILTDNWQHIDRAGKNVATLAGKHAPKVERGMDALHRVVGAAHGGVKAVDQTARGLDRTAEGTNAIRRIAEDYKAIRGRKSPNPWLVGGLAATGGAILGAAATSPQGDY